MPESALVLGTGHDQLAAVVSEHRDEDPPNAAADVDVTGFERRRRGRAAVGLARC